MYCHSVFIIRFSPKHSAWSVLSEVCVSLQIGQQTVSLRSVLDQWSLYKQAYEEIQGYLMEGRYTISRLRLLTGSPEAVQVQVENLEVKNCAKNEWGVVSIILEQEPKITMGICVSQSLQDELEKQESSLQKLGSITQQLLRDCHPSVSDSLNTALGDVNHRWVSNASSI